MCVTTYGKAEENLNRYLKLRILQSILRNQTYMQGRETNSIWQNIIICGTVHQTLFCRSLNERRGTKSKIPGKVFEWEEKLKRAHRRHWFGQVEWEVVGSKLSECARESIFMGCSWRREKGVIVVVCGFVAITGSQESQAKIICNYFACDKSGSFASLWIIREVGWNNFK